MRWNDAEQLLIDLVSIPSPSTEESTAVRALVGWMAGHGYQEAFVDAAGNAVGVIGQGPQTLVLLGHIDTFGAPLPVKLEGRRLYGRGSVDAKGALCAFAAAGAGVHLGPDWRLVVIGAVEEECPTSKGAHFAAAAYQPDLCIIGEPSGWDRLTLGYKGRLLIDWHWSGGLGHSAGMIPTAAEHAFAAWERVRAFTEGWNSGRARVFDRLDSTLQRVQTATDGVLGWADLTVGFRLPPDLAPEGLAEQLTQNVLADGYSRPYGMEHAITAPRDSAISRVMRAAIREHGGTPSFVYKTGTSDMNVVAPVWNCPLLAYGPGDSALDHTPEECIDLDDYTRTIAVLSRALTLLP